ncbi:MAG: hypothetical protein QGF46_08330 [Planctomycetota bacterium]|jgi:hypothetical protein|nr:hypothetical protein [Planctomycetota bacterium]
MTTQDLAPGESTRNRIVSTIWFSVLIPGLGHFLLNSRKWAIFWFALCQSLLIGGLYLAEFTQFDYGNPIGIGGNTLIYFLIPEGGNFLTTQLFARMYESLESGGRFPTEIPWRNLGFVLSAMSGLLSLYAAAHAAGLVSQRSVRSVHAGRLPNPGKVALLNFIIPGLGHYKTGRKFKGLLLGGSVLTLFFVGMMLGDWADFDRQRHSYYWVGQMCFGAPGWITALLSEGASFEAVLPYQDVGLLFTTSAGFFNVISSLDAFHRAEHDLLILDTDAGEQS